MHTYPCKSPAYQRGAFFSTALIVLLFGIMLTAILKIAPAYLDNNVVVSTMKNMAESENLAEMSQGEIRSSLMRTLNVNNVDLPGDALQVVREGGQEYIDINYETRVDLFYNISAVVSFNNRFEKSQ